MNNYTILAGLFVFMLIFRNYLSRIMFYCIVFALSLPMLWIVAAFIGWKITLISYSIALLLDFMRVIGNSYASSSTPPPTYQESWVRQVGQPGNLYTYTSTPVGTSVNKYGSPAEDAVIFQKTKQ